MGLRPSSPAPIPRGRTPVPRARGGSGSRRFVVGILGGIAAGKSTVAAEFAACGAEVLDADAIAHACLERPKIRARVRERFGEGVFRAEGSVDRAALAAAAFASDEARRDLEAIVHPCVRAALEERLAARGPGIVVLDAPLLEEAGLARVCDATVFVDAPRRVRAARAAARGWTPEELARRESSQIPPEEKRGRARIVIRNDGSRARLRDEVARLYARLLERARATRAARTRG
ncbi:MAG TPA: dephospho-CoA kinase [Planctomycetota bacterium]|jgi:dephospho-CoA kinase|nr:dephospho-CoA kinase [Planctomycetota bacterium]